jgi:predicted metal-dependent hydrolase
MWGVADVLVARLDAARRDGVDASADQYPYTAAATTLATVLPPAILALTTDEIVAAIRDPATRASIRDEQARGVSGWENVTADPGWAGIVISHSDSRPEWAGRSLADLAADTGADPADLALDVLADDRLAVDVVIHCMAENDVETIMRVPWIGVCTDAKGRQPGHPILDAGVPHPRTYGSTARVLGEFSRGAGHRPRDGHREASAVPAARAASGTGAAGGRLADVVVRPVTVADRPPTSARPCTRRSGCSERPAGGPRRPRTGERPPPPACGQASAGPWSTSPCRRHRRDRRPRLPGPRASSCAGRRGHRLRDDPARAGVVVSSVRRAARLGRPEPAKGRSSRAEALVRRHLERQEASRARLDARPALDDGRLVPYLGLAHRVRVVPAPPGVRASRVSRVGADGGDELVIERVARDRRQTAAILEAWFRARARRALDAAIARHGPPLGVAPARITLRDTTSRWGSCSRKGNLSFSWRLVLAPPEALDAVAAHELCHLRVFGHGPRFIALLASRVPDHAAWRRWLRKHSAELHAAID